jgi:uncharacterized protein YecE (DUF72 family)
MTQGRIYVGTAGFSYRDWLGNFYPQFCPPADFLRCYAMTFNSVELDSTFYRLPTRQNIEKWSATTPESFRFTAKFPRTVTHEGELKSRLEEAEKYLEVMGGMGAKLGPLLMQFPPSFHPGRRGDLCELLGLIPRGIRVAVELRCRDWLTDELFSLLERHGVSLCLAEFPGMPQLTVRTADFVYLRFVGDHQEIPDNFSYVRRDRKEELAHWTSVVEHFIGEKADIFAYFNNHFSGHAPSTALEFRDRVKGSSGDGPLIP